MNDLSQYPVMDELDCTILEILQTDGRISHAELARQINLSQPAVYNRIKRLEKRGYIQGYVALLDHERLGYDLMCFVQVSIQAHAHENVQQFYQAIENLPEVLECYHITGDHDYLLKVLIRNRKDMERFVIDRLTTLPGVDRIKTSLVLREVKETTAISVG